MQAHSSYRSKEMLPQYQIVCGIIESYLNIRKGTWNLDENSPIEQVNEIGKEKIAACIDILNLACKALTYDDWVKVFDFCAQKEKSENPTPTSWFTYISQCFCEESLLLNTLQAIADYIYSILMLNKKCLIDNKGYAKLHENYFAKIISTLNPAPHPFTESSFVDFQINILNKKRSLNLCQKILGQKILRETQFKSITAPMPFIPVVIPASNQNEKINHQQETKTKEYSALQTNSVFSRKAEKFAVIVTPPDKPTHGYNLRKRK